MLFADSAGHISLGLCVGQLCYFRFVLPATLNADGAVVPLEEEAIQCSPEQVAVVLGTRLTSPAELEAALTAARLAWQKDET